MPCVCGCSPFRPISLRALTPNGITAFEIGCGNTTSCLYERGYEPPLGMAGVETKKPLTAALGGNPCGGRGESMSKRPYIVGFHANGSNSKRVFYIVSTRLGTPLRFGLPDGQVNARVPMRLGKKTGYRSTPNS